MTDTLPSPLRQALQNNSLALFVGADLPVQISGLPSRRDLAQAMARHFGVDEALSLAQAAQRSGSGSGRFEFTNFLRQALDTFAIQPRAFHMQVARLVKSHAVRLVITTAYDDLLEQALRQQGVAFNSLVRASDVSFANPSQPTLVRLYGDAKQVDTLVITERDHFTLLKEKPDLVDEVRQAFKRYTVLFLGYNLSDPDFRFIFDQIAESKFARPAYAVWAGLPEAEVRVWDEQKVYILEEDVLETLEKLAGAQPNEGWHDATTQPNPHPAIPVRPAAVQEPGVSVSLLTHFFPSAYARSLDVEHFPWVKAQVKNETGQRITVRASAVVEGYSNQAVETVALASGDSREIALLPILKTMPATISPAALHISVEQVKPAQCLLYERTKHIHLQAQDVAILGLRSEEGAVTDLTRYLAGWVTPTHPAVEKLLRRAVEHHPLKRLPGYQTSPDQDTARHLLRQQVRALYTAMQQEAKLAYVSNAFIPQVEPEQITQRVRLPGQCLESGGLANCLDGVVLFASLLELIGIHALLVIVPGHAFVGWRTAPGGAEIECLETTMLGQEDTFEEALGTALGLYANACKQGLLERNLFDPAGYARVIDIAQCRKEGIFALQ